MNSVQKIYSREDLVQQVKAWQSQNQRIVFTNGCFDILHLGHVDYLEKARQLGDKLIVGVNTDTSVSHLIVLQNGGEVKTIALVKGYSTTNVIDKVKRQIKE